jgi:hypothetical protein
MPRISTTLGGLGTKRVSPYGPHAQSLGLVPLPSIPQRMGVNAFHPSATVQPEEIPDKIDGLGSVGVSGPWTSRLWWVSSPRPSDYAACGSPATTALKIRPTRTFADRSIGSATPSRFTIRCRIAPCSVRELLAAPPAE